MTLLALVAGGWTAGHWLARRPIEGRDLSDDPAARAILADRSAPMVEAPGADLTMVVFTDFRCPACRIAAPAMDAAVAADGRMRVLYRDWPIFGAPSLQAARVALAAGYQHRYAAVHRRLMAEPRALDDAVLREAVRAAGGDLLRLAQDLDRHDAAIAARLAANAEAAAQLGLPGTPGWLIGARLHVGALDRDGFAAAFAEARADQQQRPPPLP